VPFGVFFGVFIGAATLHPGASCLITLDIDDAGENSKPTALFAPIGHFHNARQLPMKGHIDALE
jgi:hypothetical protein